MKRTFTFLLFLSFVAFSQIQANNFWNDIAEGQMVLAEDAEINQSPNHYRTLSLDFQSMIETLRNAPLERTSGAPIQIALPLPNGTNEVFEIYESPILAPELAAQFPQIKTFSGRSMTNPTVTTRLDYSPNGFNAIIHTIGGTVLINPYATNQTQYYISFDIKEVDLDQPAGHHGCQVKHDEDDVQDYDIPDVSGITAGNRDAGDPVDFRTYRLALATTGEFFSSHGNSVPNVLASVTNIINSVNSIFEKDVAIRLELIANTTDVFYSNSVTDPYTNGNVEELIQENFFEMNLQFGADAFDIGHVFGTNTGGLANLAGVCNDDSKARGTSNTFGNYSGSLFYIIVAHEMGHQFSATHNFNFCDADNETWQTGYEPGAGSTIMCYSGASDCDNNWIQNVDDDYYHINAISRIRNFSRNPVSGGGCAEIETTDNTTPTASVNNASGFFIPILTPFELTGEASDDEDSDFLYNWEQYDAANVLAPYGNPMQNSPAFRSFPPSNNPTRIFPKIETIINNASTKEEVLVDYTRDFTFRFSVRDCNPGGGGFDFADVAFKTTDQAGPFLVNSPNDGSEVWEVGDYVEVSWDVANSDADPVNCQMVDILLSTDGGYTYPVTLAKNTANDGTQFIVVPDEIGSNLRVKVAAADNIFFDISNANFEIVAASQPDFAFTTPVIEGDRVCLPTTISVDLGTTALAGFSEMISFSIEGLPANASATFSPAQVMPGETSTLSIEFTEDLAAHGVWDLTLKAEANGVDVQERPASYFLISNDFSALALQSPADGSGNQNTLQSFDWNDLVNATSYNFEIATSPSFNPGTIVHQEIGIPESNYDLVVTLDNNQDYYWRVAAVNECGSSDATSPYTLHTLFLTCTATASTDGPHNISSQGLPVASSVISISDNVTVNDVNVLNIDGTHDAIADLEFRLKGPNDQTILLFTDPLCFNTNFDFGFDDESALMSPSPCSPSSGLLYQPQEALSAFDNIDGSGNWTLEVAVVNELGNGGNFQTWEIEICGGKDAINPELINNIPLRLKPGENRQIRKDSLLVTDADNSAAELEYTIVEAPEYGFVELNGSALDVGDTFTQADINNQKVRYENLDDTATEDSFTFIVKDGEGGFLGTPRHHIIIDPNTPMATTNLGLASQVYLYPNPASNLVNIVFEQQMGTQLSLSVYNNQGQEIAIQLFENFGKSIQLNTSKWANGFYTIVMRTDLGVIAKKVVVE